jgi:hypothetical protein
LVAWGNISSNYSAVNLAIKYKGKYSRGARVLGYNWPAFNLSAFESVEKAPIKGIFEFDLGYISVPRAKFDHMINSTFKKIFTPTELDCSRIHKCSILLPCD